MVKKVLLNILFRSAISLRTFFPTHPRVCAKKMLLFTESFYSGASPKCARRAWRASGSLIPIGRNALIPYRTVPAY